MKIEVQKLFNWLNEIKKQDDINGTNLSGFIIVFSITILFGLVIWTYS